MNKVVCDDGVAVLIRRQYGVGWSTAALHLAESKELLFDAEIVCAVIDCDAERAEALAQSKYQMSAAGLQVVWVKQGEAFQIHEDSGYESVVPLWHTYVA